MGERSVGFGYSMIQITVEPKQGAVSGRRSFRYGVVVTAMIGVEQAQPGERVVAETET